VFVDQDPSDDLFDTDSQRIMCDSQVIVVALTPAYLREAVEVGVGLERSRSSPVRPALSPSLHHSALEWTDAEQWTRKLDCDALSDIEGD
jgi:hypothetical protein